MEKRYNTIKTLVVLYLFIFWGSAVNAQVGVENGIHVNGGSSSETKVSSNILGTLQPRQDTIHLQAVMLLKHLDIPQQL